MTEVVCGLAAPKAGDVILDAGCGFGATSIWLAQTYDVKVVGICPNEIMIRDARKRAHKAGVTGRVSFEVADMTASGLADGAFDIIIAQESTSHTAGPAAFYGEFHRLLRANGRAVLTDFVVNAAPDGSTGERAQFWKTHWHLYGMATQDEHVAQAARRGLHLSEWRDLSSYVEPTVRRLARAARRVRRFNDFLGRLGARNDTEVQSILATAAMREAFDRKQWSYALFRLDRQDR
jgi:cyclopropane fatty-acyl-phospholipid synthase-like methyltransferase